MCSTSADARLAAVDRTAVAAELDAQDWTILPALIDAGTATRSPRSTIARTASAAASGWRVTASGGEYRYFSCPLPRLVQDLRGGLYPHLAPIANRWHARMDVDTRFPDTHRAFSPDSRSPNAGLTRELYLLSRQL